MAGDAIADCLTGTFTFGAIGAALFARERTGAGAHIDIAMFDCMLAILQTGLATYLATGETPRRIGNNSLAGRAVRRVPHRRRRPGDLRRRRRRRSPSCAARSARRQLADRPALRRHRDARRQSRRAAQRDWKRRWRRTRRAEWVDAPPARRRAVRGRQHDRASGRGSADGGAQHDRALRRAARMLGNPIKLSTLPDPPERPRRRRSMREGADLRRELGQSDAGRRDG